MNQTKTCTKCNIQKSTTEFHKSKKGKDGLRAICKTCRRKYAFNNKEQISKYQAEYRDNHKTILAKQKTNYYLDNKNKLTEYYHEYYQNNKEQVAAYQSKYYSQNKDKVIERVSKYVQTPKGKAVARASSQNRRAAKLQNGGKHTGAEILALFDLQSGVCPYCQTKLYKSGKNKYHADHIVPLSKGGSNDITNIQLLCPKCNLTKNDKLPEEFAANFGKLF